MRFETGNIEPVNRKPEFMMSTLYHYQSGLLDNSKAKLFYQSIEIRRYWAIKFCSAAPRPYDLGWIN